MLLEHGERMTVEDLRMMPKPGSQRSNVFDFRAVDVVGDVAYAHWFLESRMTDGSFFRIWAELIGAKRVAPFRAYVCIHVNSRIGLVVIDC